jgi:Big-like domain-containing protein
MKRPHLRSPSPLARRASAIGASLVITLVGTVTALAADTLDPPTVVKTLEAGQSTTVDKTFHLDALPANADIVFAVDTTGSMGGAISQAKTDAANIVTAVQAQIPNARFALADFKDYDGVVDDRTSPPTTYTCVSIFSCNFGQPGDYPYRLVMPLTGGPGAATAFSTAVGTLSASGGGDGPEAYNRAFFEAVNDPALVYAPNAVKFLIVLGDNIGHDPNQMASFSSCPNTLGPDPGRDAVIGEPLANDDLPTLDVINGMAAANDKLLMISYGSFLSCYKQLVAPTGGVAVASTTSSTLTTVVVDAIKAAAAHIGEAHLEVVGPCLLGITFSPTSYANQTAPIDLSFTETITAPNLVGTYVCTVRGVADGTQRGNTEEITITVTPGRPFKVVLTPEVATNPVGTRHCVTATVTDIFGNPVPGVSVVFAVPTSPATHASPASGGPTTTNASGQAQFCFTASLPGADTIQAAVDSNGSGKLEPSDQPSAVPATKIWTLPPTVQFCEVKITDGGWIIANNGDRANFGGNAKSDNGSLSGQEEFQDQGPAQAMNVHSTKITAITCDDMRQNATIFGEATIDGSAGTPPWIFRIDVRDMGSPSTNDAYGIMLSNGYDSGEHSLGGGNITIH